MAAKFSIGSLRLFAALLAAACSSSDEGNGAATSAHTAASSSSSSSSSSGAGAYGGAGGSSGGAGGATSGGGGAGGGSACQGPAWPQNAACEACETENCCLTGANCAADPECVALVACTQAGQSCSGDHPEGVWNFSGLAVCLQNSCATECGVPQAECGGIQPTPASCTPEVHEKCCEETAACGESDACLAFVYQCIDQNQCQSQACYEDCLAQYPDAEAPFEALATCWETLTCL
jgi:hypothetical protein